MNQIDGLVRQVHFATAELRRARWRLAEASTPPLSVLVEPTWDWARKILVSRKPRLRALRGVVGYGLGTRVRAGLGGSEPCLRVYVQKRDDAAELPAKVGTGPRSIGLDVVELGGPEIDLAPPGFEPGRVVGTWCPEWAPAGGQVPVQDDIDGLGALRAWRPALFPADVGVAVRLAGRVSGLQCGVLDSAYVHLPGWGLEMALLARIHSQPGDSGSPLIDSDGLVLGFLVGRATGGDGGLRVFRPAADAGTPSEAASR